MCIQLSFSAASPSSREPIWRTCSTQTSSTMWSLPRVSTWIARGCAAKLKPIVETDPSQDANSDVSSVSLTSLKGSPNLDTHGKHDSWFMRFAATLCPGLKSSYVRSETYEPSSCLDWKCPLSRNRAATVLRRVTSVMIIEWCELEKCQSPLVL